MLLFTGSRYVQLQQSYRAGATSYDALRGQVRQVDEENPSDDPFVRSSVDFEALQKINPDTIGWLYSPQTPIDYPVMKANDYAWYLSHLIDGSYNACGTLFLDYNNAPDFSDKLSVIYGHNMQDDSMFGSLDNYKNQAFLNEHPTMFLFTPQGNYRVELMYGCVVGAGMWRDRAFMFEVNLESLLSYASQHTTFTSPVTYAEGDRVVALSTCSYEFDDARYVVIGILKPAK